MLVTNLTLQPLNLWRFYNGRAGVERIIRELKGDYPLGKIPTRHFFANEAYFHLLLCAYNLVNWCASRRTRTRSVGGSPTEGRARPLVARAAERRETESPKPADKAVGGTVSESPGRSESEREVASKTRRSGGRACTSWAKAAGKQRIWQKSCSPSGGVISGGMVARARRATGEALLAPGEIPGSWVGLITGSDGKGADGERVAEGPGVARKAGNAAGAKGPCWGYFLRRHGRQGSG